MGKCVDCGVSFFLAFENLFQSEFRCPKCYEIYINKDSAWLREKLRQGKEEVCKDCGITYTPESWRYMKELRCNKCHNEHLELQKRHIERLVKQRENEGK